MRETIKKIMAVVCLVAICLLTGYFIGNFRVSNEKVQKVSVKPVAVKQEEIPQIKYNRTIAIVNLDEGITQGDTILNYGNSLISTIDTDIRVTGLQDARNGIESGEYSAYLVIPSTFSTNVMTINEKPVTTEITYAVASGLKGEKRDNAIYDVYAIYNSLSSNVSQIYTSTILDEYHDAQDAANTIMSNDTKDMNVFMEIQENDLIQTTDIPEFEEVEFNVTELKLDEDYEKNEEYVDNIDVTYQESLKNANTGLDLIRFEVDSVYNESESAWTQVADLSGILNDYVENKQLKKEDLIVSDEEEAKKYQDWLTTVGLKIDNYNTLLEEYNKSVKSQVTDYEYIELSYRNIIDIFEGLEPVKTDTEVEFEGKVVEATEYSYEFYEKKDFEAYKEQAEAQKNEELDLIYQKLVRELNKIEKKITESGGESILGEYDSVEQYAKAIMDINSSSEPENPMPTPPGEEPEEPETPSDSSEEESESPPSDSSEEAPEEPESPTPDSSEEAPEEPESPTPDSSEEAPEEPESPTPDSSEEAPEEPESPTPDSSEENPEEPESPNPNSSEDTEGDAAKEEVAEVLTEVKSEQITTSSGEQVALVSSLSEKQVAISLEKESKESTSEPSEENLEASEEPESPTPNPSEEDPENPENPEEPESPTPNPSEEDPENPEEPEGPTPEPSEEDPENPENPEEPENPTPHPPKEEKVIPGTSLEMGEGITPVTFKITVFKNDISEPSVTIDDEPCKEMKLLNKAEIETNLGEFIDSVKETSLSKTEALNNGIDNSTAMQEQYVKVEEAHTSLEASQAELGTQFEQYDLNSFINSEQIGTSLSMLLSTTQDIADKVTTHDLEYKEYTDNVYQATEKNVNDLKENIAQSQELSQQKITESLEAAKNSRAASNETNIRLLKELTSRLPYTRLGNIENKEVYTFMARPVTLYNISKSIEVQEKQQIVPEVKEETVTKKESNQLDEKTIWLLAGLVVVLIVAGIMLAVKGTKKPTEDF